MVLDFGLGEQSPAPLGEASASFLEFVVKCLVCLVVHGLLTPRFCNHLTEPWYGNPEVLEFESSRPPRANGISKQKGTVIGERGG